MGYQNGQKTEAGYLALPTSGGGPGILVLHAWWGLNAFFTGLCDRLAQEGFVALAPDLYGGGIASTIEEAEALQANFDFGAAQQKAVQALEVLQQQSGVQAERLGALGCSMGAAWALTLSSLFPEQIAASVLFYGVSEADFSAARCAYLIHCAENDAWDPVEQAREMEAAMRVAGREVAFYVYPDVGHWFLESDRPDAYNPEAAQLAWERSTAFLKQHLQGTAGG